MFHRSSGFVFLFALFLELMQLSFEFAVVVVVLHFVVYGFQYLR